MTGKRRELVDMTKRNKADMLCMKEIRWKGSKDRSTGNDSNGVDRKRNGIGLILKEGGWR